MNIKQLIRDAKADAPLLLGKIPETRAARLAREILALIRAEIAVTDEGEVRVPGLGVFKIRQVEVTRNGEPKTRKRVVLALAKPRPKRGARVAPRRKKRVKPES